MSISNDRAKRAVKPFVIGRKAWWLSHTRKGAEARAIFYNIIETAKPDGLTSFEYIIHCLERISKVLRPC
ncbi:hypothetical protein IW644_16970 [Alteromonas sp. PRIM-21]|nr:hypothetical protein [Alteromonas sp. PRIM-21]